MPPQTCHSTFMAVIEGYIHAHGTRATREDKSFAGLLRPFFLFGYFIVASFNHMLSVFFNLACIDTRLLQDSQ